MSVLFDPKLERMAKDGNEMPDGLEYPDQVMYLCLRMLYEQLRTGMKTPETEEIKAEKAALLTAATPLRPVHISSFTVFCKE